MEREILGSVYYKTSEDFMRGIYPIARTVKAEQHDLAVVEMEERRLGNIYGFEGGNYAGNVYDKEMLSPTIRTYQGGNQQPMIVQTKPLGNLNGYKLGSGYAGSVYDTDGLSPTINTMGGGSREPMIVAMCGRNPDNPSDRTAGIPLEQRLEPNSQGICNTLTSVQKDNMVLIKQAAKEGFIECEYGGIADLSFPQSRTRRGRVQDGVNICPAITVESNGLCRIETQYRIRKLTPLECWRLMGFTDEDFLKAEKTNSNSQLYKQAGNSIVKDVLMAVFRQMLPGGKITRRRECKV